MNKSRRLNRFKDFIIKYKNQFIAGISVILLALITLFISYAYYQVTNEKKIIGGQIGEISDIEIRIMVQKRDENGNAIDKEYEIYPYIPQAGYDYNPTKSKCANGSTIDYNAETHKATLTTKGIDVCYLYFDSNAPLDVTLDLYAQDIDENGQGIPNKYTKLDVSSLPVIGYKLGEVNCDKGGSVSYDAENNLILVDAKKRNTKCTVKMDALDVDVLIKLHIEAKKDSNIYYDALKIPDNVYFVKNTEKSKCTNSATIEFGKDGNQELAVSSLNKTVCDLYLDIDNGPIPSSILLSKNKNNTVVSFGASNLGTNVESWYYSLDGKNYQKTDENIITLNEKPDNLYVYGEDASGNTSRIITTNGEDYVYNGLFNYSSSVQTQIIEVSGYYKLEVWGAQGGSYNSNYAQGGKGGYSTGIVYLNKGDTLFIHTGEAGSYNANLTTVAEGGVNGGGSAGYRGGTGGGATDIRINNDSLYARVIVAGGGGGAYTYNKTYKADGGYAGGFVAGRGNYLNELINWAGGAGSISAGGFGGVGFDSQFNGNSGTFGLGGSTSLSINDANYYSSGAGGGGFYGGGAGANFNGQDYKKGAAGGGGSGYVYTEQTAEYYPEGCLLNANYFLSNAKSYAGNTEFLNPTGQKEMGHTGSGYAKITYMGQKLKEE